MLRTAVKPQWLGLLALVIAVTIGFAFLGRWQLDVAQEKGLAESTAESAARPAAPLAEVMKPGTAFTSEALDRKVTLAGEYAASQQVFVAGRKMGERPGYWVVAPLRVEGSHDPGADPAAIPILRGFVADPADAPAPPTGRVTITGTLAQSEPSPDQFRPMPAGQIQMLNVPVLLNRWGGELYNAFVFLGTQEPADPAGSMTVVPPPASGVGQLNWRNFGYALQWFFFAAFALYMWARMVREDAQSQQARGLQTLTHDAPAPAPVVVPATSNAVPSVRSAAGETPEGEPSR